MSETIKFETLAKQTKREMLKRKVKAKIQNGKEWLSNNRDAVIALAPVVVGGLATVTKVVGKRINLSKAKELKDERCFDRSLGHYWVLKRKLSNQEWLEIDKRKKNGERLADILEELKVLK